MCSPSPCGVPELPRALRHDHTLGGKVTPLRGTVLAGPMIRRTSQPRDAVLASPMSRPYEQEQRDLNPNRDEEERHARLESEYRLNERGIRVAPRDSDEGAIHRLVEATSACW